MIIWFCFFERFFNPASCKSVSTFLPYICAAYYFSGESFPPGDAGILFAKGPEHGTAIFLKSGHYYI
jgi:hypothetical protein